MKKIKILTLLILAFLVLLLVGIKINLINIGNVNIVNGNNIYKSTGWKENTSSYAGSEIRFILQDSRTLSFEIQSNSKADQGIQIFIDDKKYLLRLPPEKGQIEKLSVNLDKQESHIVSVRHFCTYLYDPCSITLKGIYVERGSKLQPYNPNKKIMSILGDSISTIYGEKNYSFILADALGFELHNASILGSTVSKAIGADNAINRYKKDLEPYSSDITIIFLGTNDAAHNIPLETFEKDYSSIITNIQKWNPNGKVVTVNLLPRQDISYSQLDEYRTEIKRISLKYNTQYIETSTWLEDKDFSDKIHPSVKSQEKLSNKFEEALTPILK